MPIWDKEKRREAFHHFLTRKQNASRSFRWGCSIIARVKLDVIDEPLWNSYREEALSSDRVRDEYIFESAARFAKHVQESIARYTDFNGQEPDQETLNGEIRGCKDFAFVLDDFTGRDLKKAVHWLEKTVAHGDKIASWYQADLATQKLQQSKGEDIYLQWGASTVPDGTMEVARRQEDNKKMHKSVPVPSA